MNGITKSLRDIFWPDEGHHGKTVYLQETGEKLGTVVDVKADQDGEIASFTVDCEGAELDISCDNILEAEQGLIYRPVWLTEAEKIVKKLEAQQRINPDIATHTTKTLSRPKIKRILKRASPEFEKTFQEAEDISAFLISKREELKNKRDSLTAEIEEMAKKRMRGEGSRKEFAETIVDLKRKAKIVEENLNKAESLFIRLKDSPLIDVERIKEDDEMAVQEPVKKDQNPSSKRKVSEERKMEEGERIKKVRIPKLEQQFGQKEEELQQAYLADLKERLKHINQDMKDLRELAEEHEGKEEIIRFIDGKMEALKKEKKDLRNKIKEVKKGKETEPVENPEEDIAEIEGVLEENDSEELQSVEGGIDGSFIARLGSLAVIIGLIVLLILSLLQVF